MQETTKEAHLLQYRGGPIKGRVRVRFAPSPTGSLHVGGARTYLFNWLYASHTKGELITRIEDTDKERSTPEFERMVMQDIHSLGIFPQESPEQGGDYGPYRQSERLPIYKVFAHKLLKEKKAYPCFCPEEVLDKKAKMAKAQGKPPHYDGTCTHIPTTEADKRIAAGEHFAIRMKVPPKDYVLEDYIRGRITFKQGMVGDFILLRSNGLPVYNFAVVVDDYLMRISHVIRAEEHMPNTLRQKILLEALSWEEPTFAHISLVLGSDRKKLSKRHGAASVEDYLRQGYLKEALLNFLALLGWSPDDNKEIRPLKEIVDRFYLKKLTKSPAIFDQKKLRWMNGEYIRAMDLEELAGRIAPFVREASLDPSYRGKEYFLKAIDSVRSHLQVLSEIKEHLCIYYPDKYEIQEDAKNALKDEFAIPVLSSFKKHLEKIEKPNPEWLKNTQKQIQEETGAKGKKLFFPLRSSITGRLHGPELSLVIPILGKEECLRRLKLHVNK